MPRTFASLTAALFATLLAAGGCSRPEFNPTPTTSEADSLGDAIQLTHNFHRAGEAYFSPDMRWIVFQAALTPTDHYLMYLAQVKWEGDRIAGLHTPIRVSPEGSWNSCGYFSPDGNSLIFSSTKAPLPKSGELLRASAAPTRPAATAPATQSRYGWSWPDQADIYRADGWKGAVSALPPGGATDLVQHALTKNDAHDAECGYSPDGRWIVYTSKVSGDLELWAMRADGSKSVQLTHAKGYDGGPFFSPDGRRICYRSDRKGGDKDLQVFVADVRFDAGGDIVGIANERQLTVDRPADEKRTLNFGKAVNWAPYWHPDGRHLVWTSSVHGHANYELYLMRDDGSHKTRVTFTAEDPVTRRAPADILPVFSPDGKWLMWTSTRGPEKTSQIWVGRFRMPKGS